MARKRFDPMLHEAEIKQYLIEKVQYDYNFVIPTHLFENMEISSYLKIELKGVIYNFKTLLAGRHYKKTIIKTKDVPANWFEHLKERFAPRWFLKRWPVLTFGIETETTITITNICPHIHVPNDNREHVKWVCTEPPELKEVYYD